MFPATGAKVGRVPQPLVLALAGLAICIPPGKGSVKLTPLIVDVVGLLIVKNNVEGSPGATVSGMKRFDMPMLEGATISKKAVGS